MGNETKKTDASPNPDPFDLSRFLAAQDPIYPGALSEIREVDFLGGSRQSSVAWRKAMIEPGYPLNISPREPFYGRRAR